MRIVRVLWRDAYYEYEGDGKVHPDYLVISTGFVIEEGETFLTIAAEKLPNTDGYRAITHIPASNVVELVDLDGDD